MFSHKYSLKNELNCLMSYVKHTQRIMQLCNKFSSTIIIINSRFSPPLRNQKSNGKAISQLCPYFLFISVVVVPLGANWWRALRVCTTLLIHEYLSTTETNLFITPTTKLRLLFHGQYNACRWIYGNSYRSNMLLDFNVIMHCSLRQFNLKKRKYL